jgi:hypothetical protein
MKDEFKTDQRTYYAYLTVDGSAPTDYGGGLIFERSKISEQETVPTKFHFWYTVFDGKLQYGWECRDPEDKATAKQVEIAERQARVKALLALNMKQKDIAKHSQILVNAATISRDVAAIKAEEQRQKTQAKLLTPLSPKIEYEDDEDDEDENVGGDITSSSSKPKKEPEDDAW